MNGISTSPGSSPSEKKLSITIASVHVPLKPLSSIGVVGHQLPDIESMYLPDVYFLGVGIDKLDRALTLCEKNSNSRSLYDFEVSISTCA